MQIGTFRRRRSVWNGGACVYTLLSSREAKKVYTQATAAALRAKDEVMTKVTTIRENADDILADAKELNDKRAAEDEVIDDCACEACETVEDAAE